MEGKWELRSYKLTFENGISEYATCSGTLEVKDTEQDGWDNEMIRTLEFSFPSLIGSEQTNGLIKFRGKGDYMDVGILNQNDSIVFVEDHRILMLNSSDLQLIYADQNGKFHTLTFKKKK
jgi:hypothetical protein